MVTGRSPGRNSAGPGPARSSAASYRREGPVAGQWTARNVPLHAPSSRCLCDRRPVDRMNAITQADLEESSRVRRPLQGLEIVGLLSEHPRQAPAGSAIRQSRLHRCQGSQTRVARSEEAIRNSRARPRTAHLRPPRSGPRRQRRCPRPRACERAGRVPALPEECDRHRAPCHCCLRHRLGTLHGRARSSGGPTINGIPVLTSSPLDHRIACVHRREKVPGH